LDHEYYVSVTQIEYVAEKKSIQIITKIDFDDLEYTIKERNDVPLDMTSLDEKPDVKQYIYRYLKSKLKFKINDASVNYDFLGRVYDNDEVICYLEITDIDYLDSISIENNLLFDNFPNQRNILRLKLKTDRYSFLCTPQKSFYKVKLN
ncbi:MAG: DUF6702 family protein, partial [Bacteroidota bacterium]